MQRALKSTVGLLVGLSCLTAMAATEDGVANSAAEAKPLKVKDGMPDTPLKTLDGKDTSIRKVVFSKKTVVVFYRGSWCPFCNRQMADLQTIQGDLKKRGYQMVAISPDTPDNLKKMVDKQKLSYQLYSDSPGYAMKAFGVAFRVDDDTVTKYRDSYHIDLEKASGETHHILPVPSVFVFNTKGQVIYVYSNPDYKIRLKGKELLAALDEK